MNLNDNKYSRFALVKEMMETPGIIKNFSVKDMSKPLERLKKSGKLFLTGEGSSRIFPAKNAIYRSLKNNIPLTINTEGSRQAAELVLQDFVIFGASNSGKTKEVISLFKEKKGVSQFALTAFNDTPLAALSDDAFVIKCGKEEAVAATKSVVEQALVYNKLILNYSGKDISQSELNELAEKAENALTMKIDSSISAKLSESSILYFAGRNNGVAEEAALKTNEITRKKSAYLEGTYAVHGIEEVMDSKESVIIIDPFKDEESKFKEVLVDGVKMNVIAVSNRDTIFPTVKIPSMPGFDGYLQLLACWNLLVEIGIGLNINLDKPARARKVGNEFIQ